MADSKQVAVNARAWTEIAVGEEKGFITNSGNDNVILREAASGGLSIDSSYGHSLGVDDDDGYSYDVSTGQSIYARATSTATQIVITPVG